jgi:sterol desaturase/sphingolipid hydroxylase (fatty acid hydroxylase superfamily)
MGNIDQLYQTVTLVVVVLFFDVLERRRPGHPIDRQRDLTLNVMALIIVVIAGEMWKVLLLNSLSALHLPAAAYLNDLRLLPSVVKITLGMIIADFCLYWVHRAMHETKLWRTHAFHHSIDALWWLSGSRTSVIHLLLFALPQIVIAYYIFGLSSLEAGVAFSIGVVVNIWIHTNLRVNLGPMEWILITPDFHRIHHGSKGLLHKNLGFVLTVWDRIFGTYVDPRSIGDDVALGAVSTKDRLFRMILGL